MLVEHGQQSEFISFAQALKNDIDVFLKEKIGVSAFTADDKEKQLIRPMLVAYGMTMRNKDPDYWIKLVDPKIRCALDQKKSVIITDARFSNEIKFVKTYPKSLTVHISRKLPDGNILQPPNEEEAAHDPICHGLTDVALTWNTFEKDSNAYTEFIRDSFLCFP